MAKRRMISIDIYSTDEFMFLTPEAQTLYTHILLRADDDGLFGNVKMLIRMLGFTDEALQPLLDKRYLLIFDSGVVAVKHWRMQNTIQKDRYNKTAYQEEFSQLKEKENKSYTEKNKKYKGFVIPKKDVMETKCLQNVNKMFTECLQDGNTDKNRLEKISIEEIRIEENILSGNIPDHIKETPLKNELDALLVNGKSKKETDIEIIKEVIDYLNEQLGSSYRYTTRKTQDLIKARLNEGFELNDFKTVIFKKVKEWKGSEWEKYLRPETLFSNKFESYLQQPIKVDKTTQGIGGLMRLLNEDKKDDEVIIDVE